MEQAALLDDMCFEDLLAEAAISPDDQQTQVALQAHMNDVLVSGDVELAVSMALAVAAMACMHPHLQTIAGTFADYMQSGSETHASHDHDGDEPGTKKRPQPKRQTLWELARIAFGIETTVQSR